MSDVPQVGVKLIADITQYQKSLVTAVKTTQRAVNDMSSILSRGMSDMSSNAARSADKINSSFSKIGIASKMKSQVDEVMSSGRRLSNMDISLRDPNTGGFTSAMDELGSKSETTGESIGNHLSSGIDSGLDKANSALSNFREHADSMASSVNDKMRTLNDGVGRLHTGFDHLSAAKMLGYGAVFGGLYKGVGALESSVGGAVKRFDTLNNAVRTFRNMGFSNKSVTSNMDFIQKSIKGLPTSMDDAVQQVEMLAGATGKLGSSTRLFKSMNDAILGFGGTSANVHTAVIQLSQALADGNINAQTWNSMLNSNLGPALSATAKKMHMTTAQLKAAVSPKNTKNSQQMTSEFIKNFDEMDTKGGAGMKSFHQIAMQSTHGIGTSITNLKTAVVRNMANMLKPINAFVKAFTGRSISGNINHWSNDLDKLFGNTHKVAQYTKEATIEGTKFKNVLKAMGITSRPLSQNLEYAGAGIAGLMALTKVIPVFRALGTTTGTAGIKLGSLQDHISPVIGAFGKGTSRMGLNIDNLGKKMAASNSRSSHFFGLLTSGAGKMTKGLGNFTSITGKLSGISHKVMSMGASVFGGFSSVLIHSLGFAVIGGAIITGIGSLNKKVLTHISSSFTAILSSFQKLITKLAAKISKNGPKMAAQGAKFINTLLNAIIRSLPKILNAGGEIMMALLKGFNAHIGSIGKRIGIIFNELMAFIRKYLPKMIMIGASILVKLINGISKELPQIAKTVGVVVGALARAFSKVFPKLLSLGSKIITYLSRAITKHGAAISRGVSQVVNELVTWLAKNSYKIFNMAGNLIIDLAKGLFAHPGRLINAALKIVGSLAKALGNFAPKLVGVAAKLIFDLASYLVKPKNIVKIIQVAYNIIGDLGEGLIKSIGVIFKYIAKWDLKVMAFWINAFRHPGQLVKVGMYIVSGIWKGIVSEWNDLMKGLKSLANDIPAGLRKVLGIHSPSRVTYTIGAYVTQGLANGMLSEKSRLSKASSQLSSIISGHNYSASGKVTIGQSYTASPKQLAVSKAAAIKSYHTLSRKAQKADDALVAKDDKEIATRRSNIIARISKERIKSERDIAKSRNSELKSAYKSHTRELATVAKENRKAQSEVGERARKINSTISKDRTKAIDEYRKRRRKISAEISKRSKTRIRESSKRLREAIDELRKRRSTIDKEARKRARTADREARKRLKELSDRCLQLADSYGSRVAKIQKRIEERSRKAIETRRKMELRELATLGKAKEKYRAREKKLRKENAAIVGKAKRNMDTVLLNVQRAMAQRAKQHTVAANSQHFTPDFYNSSNAQGIDTMSSSVVNVQKSSPAFEVHNELVGRKIQTTVHELDAQDAKMQQSLGRL